MGETYANVLTASDGTIASLATSISVTSRPITFVASGPVPASLSGGQFHIRIGNEILLVTSHTGTSWTANTVEGTTPAVHAAGARVRHVLTAESLTNIIKEQAALRVDLNTGEVFKSVIFSGVEKLVSVDWIRLSAPTNLDGTLRISSVALSWDAVDGADSYRIMRDGDLIATSSTSRYRDAAVEVSETYEYTVVAVDGDGGFSFESNSFEAFIDPALNVTPVVATTQWGPYVRVCASDVDVQTLELALDVDSGTLTATDDISVWRLAA